MEQMFRIVFQGRVRQGLTIETVKEHATLRLRISSAQADKIFSGMHVTLKQGLSAEQALLYQNTLEKLGMIVMVEAMTATHTAPAAAIQPQAPVAAIQAVAARLQDTQPKAVDSSKKVSDFERTHINLARAEALLNATDRPPAPAPAPAPAPPAPVFTPAPQTPERKRTEFGEGWLHVSGFDRLERTQQRLADAEALLLKSPQKQMPAQIARQHARQASPAQTPPSVKQLSHFTCSHCGTEHVIESSLELRIATREASKQQAG